MVNAAAKLLSLFEKSWHSGSHAPNDLGKRETSNCFKWMKEGPGNSWPISLTPVPRKILLEAISKHVDGREVIKDIWHGFTNNKSHLLTWRPSMTEWLHWWIRKIHLMPCTLTSGLWHSPTQHLVSKLETGFDGWTSWWPRNWLDGHIQSISQWLSVIAGKGCHPEWPWDRLEEWDHENLTKFNTAKRGELHLSQGNPWYWYTLGEEWTGSPELDLGN